MGLRCRLAEREGRVDVYCQARMVEGSERVVIAIGRKDAELGA